MAKIAPKGARWGFRQKLNKSKTGFWGLAILLIVMSSKKPDANSAKPVKVGRAKPGKLTILGGVLAVGGLVIAGMVTLNGGGGAQSTAGGAQTTVLVATHDLSYREVVMASDLTPKSMYTADVPAGAYTNLSDLKRLGSVATVNIPAGTPITASEMVSSADALIGVSVPSFLPIPPGYVAMTIPTGEQQGVAGYIQPGDYIAVVATHGSTTRTVYTQLHVIRTGPATFGTGTSAPAPTATADSLTIVVTECQSEYIIWLLANTTLRYNLESNSDYTGTADKDKSCPSVESAGGVTAHDISVKWPGLA
jgi:pilus assembly protein CpaB